MTLSNIFFGKRVVQEAYLNNALIYKSNGWETLPSTFTEAWLKKYDNFDSFGSEKLVFDSENNFYCILRDKTTQKANLYKFNSDGTVLWHTNIDQLNYNGYFLGCRDVYIDSNDNVYWSYCQTNYTPMHCYIDKLDKNGQLLTQWNFTNSIPDITYSYDTVVSFILEDDYCYIYIDNHRRHIDYHHEKGYKCKLHSDGTYDVLASSNDQGSYNNLTLVNGYLYGIDKYYSPRSVTRVNKDTLVGYTFALADDSVNDDAYDDINEMVADGFGNIIYSRDNGNYWKYNPNADPSVSPYTRIYTTILRYSHNISIDDAQNIYLVGVEYLNSNEVTKLAKISSDGTIIYNTLFDTKLPGATQTLAYRSGIGGVDHNGNFYYLWGDQVNSTAVIGLVKMVNIVKKEDK